MQYKLLQKELRSAETISDIRQKIFESSSGQDPHCTRAIALVFEGLALSAQNALIPLSVTTCPYPTTDFAPFCGEDPTRPHVTAAYQSISCMPCYRSLSFEVRSLGSMLFWYWTILQELRVDHYYRTPTKRAPESSSGTAITDSSVAGPVTDSSYGDPH